MLMQSGAAHSGNGTMLRQQLRAECNDLPWLTGPSPLQTSICLTSLLFFAIVECVIAIFYRILWNIILCAIRHYLWFTYLPGACTKIIVVMAQSHISACAMVIFYRIFILFGACCLFYSPWLTGGKCSCGCKAISERVAFCALD